MNNMKLIEQPPSPPTKLERLREKISPSKNVVDRFCVECGGQSRLARLLQCERQAITHWIKQGWFPPARAIQIERLTEGDYKAVNLAGPDPKPTKNPRWADQ